VQGGTIVNHGTISAGAGAMAGRDGGPSPGGIGVSMHGTGLLRNDGAILGGNGGIGHGDGEVGGAGIYFQIGTLGFVPIGR
jgi:hypothetical protein